MSITQSPPTISLLWPPDRRAGRGRLSASAVADLDLDTTVAALSAEYLHAEDIREVLLALSDDPAVIAYRQDILDDLLDDPDLTGRLSDLMPYIAALERFHYVARPDQTPLHEVVWRVGQLESYVECVQGLSAVFAGAGEHIRAEGLCQLRDVIDAIERDETFQNLVQELPDMVHQVRNIASVTIGVNLDDRLRPVEATLLAINSRKFTGETSSLLDLIFGRSEERRRWTGIAPLHTMDEHASAVPGHPSYGVDVKNPMLYPLFRDLAHVLKQVSRPIASALQHYRHTNTRFLGALKAELAFYLGAVRLIERLRASGLSMCRPEIAPKAERVCTLEASYSVNLALRLLPKDGTHRLSQPIVTNAVVFGPEGRIFVLTGPNQGGKTTYTQAVGVAQVLAQAGLYVPGRAACLSPVDNIYTHFPVEERPEMGIGRLGEEAKRLNDIFTRATPYSLVLLNESLASTSPGESLYLARDIVRVLRRLGARAIYATHLHELAAGVEEMNAETPGDSVIISLVSLVDESHADDGTGTVRQTYRIVPGPPRGRSYAREIASRYGISYVQLHRLLESRGLVDGDEDRGVGRKTGVRRAD